MPAASGKPGPRGLRDWLRRRSLRARLTGGSMIVITVVLVAAGTILVWRVRAGLVAQLDATATQQAAAVAASVAGADRPVVPAGLPGDPAVQVIGPTGAVLANSPNIDGEPRLFSFPAAAATASPTIRTVSGVPIGDNGTYRVAALTAGGAAAEAPLVYVALPLSEVTRNVATLVTALAVGIPILVATLAGLTWLLVGRALRSVDALSRQAAGIPATALHRRLDVPPTRDELARLATTLNELLARVDASVRRQQRFVADAAHELRSPLAAMLAELDVAARHQTEGTHAEVIEAVTLAAQRLALLVDDLLALAGLEDGPLRTGPVDLDDIVLAESAGVRRRAEVSIDLSAVSAVRIDGDRVMLTRVVRNLLDNGARHARSRVRLRLAQDDAAALLVVSDDGPGVPEMDRERIFERFTRLDAGRARDAGGAGLGLAIVRQVVAAHGGTVDVRDGNPGAVFVVRLPMGSHRTLAVRSTAPSHAS